MAWTDAVVAVISGAASIGAAMYYRRLQQRWANEDCVKRMEAMELGMMLERKRGEK